jgi:hypothetical protein
MASVTAIEGGGAIDMLGEIRLYCMVQILLGPTNTQARICRCTPSMSTQENPATHPKGKSPPRPSVKSPHCYVNAKATLSG